MQKKQYKYIQPNLFIMKQEQSKRIQTSILNGIEKRVLVWLAERQPRWITSDALTGIGVVGSLIVALGYILSSYHTGWLWLASLGFVINWYGDSLDGTLARVRNTQRPIYGFYLDHNIDGITMAIMCIGAGLSNMLNLYIAMGVLAVYLLLSISVYINAHLKGEFKLTYAGMGPTEFRLIMIIINTLFATIAPLREWAIHFTLLNTPITFGAFDFFGLIILIVLIIIHLNNFKQDAKDYAKLDPAKPF